MRLAFNLDGLAALELVLRLRRDAIHLHLSCVDQHLHPCARDVGQSLREIEIDAHAGGRWIGGKRTHLGVVVFKLDRWDDHWFRFLDATRGHVLGANAVAALTLGKHALRRQMKLLQCSTCPMIASKSELSWVADVTAYEHPACNYQGKGLTRIKAERRIAADEAQGRS